MLYTMIKLIFETYVSGKSKEIFLEKKPLKIKQNRLCRAARVSRMSVLAGSLQFITIFDI